MLVNFFYTLKRAEIPVSINEYLVLLEALQQHLAFADIDDFYHLARLCLIKDESNFDKFDRVFGAYFKQLESLEGVLNALIPEEWLRSEFMKQLSDEEKAKIKSLGGLEELLDAFKERLKEQEKRHQGGSKWIGTGGTSPFGMAVIILKVFVWAVKAATRAPPKCGKSANLKTLMTACS